MVLSRTDYLTAIDELIDRATSKHTKEIVAVYLAASVAIGDFSPGRSDIDIYVVAQRMREALEKKLKKEAEEVAKTFLTPLRRIHQEPVAVTVTTISEVSSGNSFLGAGFEYQNFMKTGKLLYGQEIRPLIPKPTRNGEKALAKRALEQAAASVRSSLHQPDQDNRDRLAYFGFSAIFRTAAIALCGEGIYLAGKDKVVKAFCRLRSDQRELCDELSWAFRL
jgi:predicted nucleotidyltransferase